MKILKLSQLKPDPNQPRQEFNPYDLELLKRSIASQGILSPLVVEKNGDGRYIIVDGERRFRASTQLGLKEVPVEIVEKMSAMERLVRRFHLQEQHRNWSYFDKARAIKMMIATGDLKEKEVSEVLGISNKNISELLALLSMSKRTQGLSAERRISYPFLVRTNRVMGLVKDKKLRPQVEEALVDRMLSGQIKRANEVDDFARSIKKGGLRIVKKLISDKDYDCSDALLDSRADDVKIYESIRGGINWTVSRFNEGLRKKAYKWVEGKDLSQLKKAHSLMGAFIKLAE